MGFKYLIHTQTTEIFRMNSRYLGGSLFPSGRRSPEVVTAAAPLPGPMDQAGVETKGRVQKFWMGYL